MMNDHDKLMQLSREIAAKLQGVKSVNQITDTVDLLSQDLSSREFDFVEREVFKMLNVSSMSPEAYEEMMMYGCD